jgi:hypothetical protein
MLYLDEKLRGLFSTRAPSRPNPIGISIVRLTKIEDNILYIHVPKFDQRKTAKTGWLKNKIKRIPIISDDG